MTEPLRSDEATRWVDRLSRSAARTECGSCECFQALLTKVQMDCPDAAMIARPLTIGAKNMHHCLCCEPCPPADVFADYLRR